MSDTTVEVLRRELEKYAGNGGKSFLRVGGNNVSVDIAAFVRSDEGKTCLIQELHKGKRRVQNRALERVRARFADVGVTLNGVSAKRSV